MIRTLVVALAVGGLVPVVGDDDEDATRLIELPGDQVFPEGIAVDDRTGAFYVGSTADGSVYRGDADDADGAVEVFAAPGADGRTAVTGMEVDDAGRLFVAGRDTGLIFVYDTASGELLDRFEAASGEEPTLINDIAVTADAVFVTDSFRPVLYRLALTGDDIGEPEEWLRFDEGPLRYEEGFNLNGIVATDDERSLIVVQYNTGGLFRIEIATGEIAPIDLDGESAQNGDGMLLDGSTLFIARAAPEQEIVEIELDVEAATGRIVDRIRDEAFDEPTTFAAYEDRFLVVNSQLSMAGDDGQPTLPFTVVSLKRPD